MLPPLKGDRVHRRKAVVLAQEIERKFLVANDGWKSGVIRRERLRDGLISATDGRKVRVRFQDDRATLTVKGQRQGLLRDEYEYPIPATDAEEMLEKHCAGNLFEKTRYHVPAAGLIWTVDLYHGILEGITIAEVELPTLAYLLEIPAWVGREVTGLQEYRKINMLAARQKQREQIPLSLQAGPARDRDAS